MTSLRFEQAVIAGVGLLATLTLTACPRGDFNLGSHDGGMDDAGSGGMAGAAGGGKAGRGGTGGAAGGDDVACGSRGLAQCDDGQYCSFSEEASCGDTDKPGVCKAKPEVCTEEYAAVCGCDGQTYGNACTAAGAGASIRSTGECEGDGDGDKVCGGFSGAQCDDGEYCKYPLDAICGIADATGVCEKIPDVCTRELKEVCGCDGKTYSNDCEAASSGTGVMQEGRCDDDGDQMCGYTISASCPDTQYCQFDEVGQCGDDAFGKCVDMPSACTKEYNPVCGCDGTTYGNDCAAASAGVSVVATGECAPTGAVCGVRGAAECADNEYCNFPEGSQCAAADVPGNCAPRPENCTLELNPVCGCDGNTYSNPCVAAQGGASVSSTGECDGGSEPGSEPAACGGLQGLQCPDGQFCNFPPDAQCGAADQLGQCADVPTACTREFAPVCGCDGTTYGNDCTAAAASISIVSEGECPSQEQACGGLQGLQCADTEFCNFAPDAQCGAADQTGVCQVRPEVCTQDYVPVCGCNDMTYGNACTAQSAGISILHDGEC